VALLGGQRSDLGVRVGRVAHRQRVHQLDELRGERVVDVGVHDEPLRGDTRLPVVLHPSRHGHLRGLLQVGRRHHNERVAAPELQHSVFHLVAGDRGDRSPGRLAPGQRCRDNTGIAQNPFHLRRSDKQSLKATVRETATTDYVSEIQRGLGHVHRFPAEVDMHYPVAVGIEGDISASLDALTQRLDGIAFDISPATPSCDLLAQEIARGQQDSRFPMVPQRVVADTRAALGRGDVVLVDTGAVKMWMGRLYPTYQPNTCLISNGLSTMASPCPARSACGWPNPTGRCSP
jgi:hypothetical protein